MVDLQHPASETLYAYDDGGLTEGERRAVERHLRGCASCRERLAHAADLPHALKARFAAESAPLALRAAVRAQIHGRPEARAVTRHVPPLMAVAAAAAVALLLLAAVLIGGRLTASEQPLLAQLAGAHARLAQDPTLIQKQGEPAVFEEWFQPMLQVKIRVPAMADLQVAGGRIDSIEGQPAAHVLYQRDGSEAMSLLVWRGAGALSEFTPREYDGNHVYVGQQGTVTVILWPVDGLRYACVGTEPPEQMLELAAHVWRTVSD
jgi:anti-sigma factor RsiW